MFKYDFKCEKCGKVFEASKQAKDPCPPCECGGETYVYFLTAPKVHFQGGGWAKDNYSSTKLGK